MDSLRTRDSVMLGGRRWQLHRLDRLGVDHLPFTLKVLLENLLRHEDGQVVTAEQVEAVRRWDPTADRRDEVDLHPTRVFLHDTNGVPTLVDLAAMRDALAGLGGDPQAVNPVIPAELVADHSVIADVFGRPDARDRNVELEYARNSERYRFLKWGQTALDRFKIVPPGMGIMHQVNIEYLARVVEVDGDRVYPDVCLGTDSHTTMVNGLGVLGWGIGGIEAEAVMLGQSLSLVVPPVVGFRLTGALPPGATATDLVLTITELLRGHGVVGKFVEFHGPGVTRTSVADRVTIANMSPEFGSTCAVFPIDAQTLRYLRFTGPAPSTWPWSRRTPGGRDSGISQTGSSPTPSRSSSTWAAWSRPWPGRDGRRTGCPSALSRPPSGPSWAAPRASPPAGVLDRRGVPGVLPGQ